MITEKLFYDIQDAIDGKRKRQRPNVKELSNAAFELRGFLACPKCGKTLTVSSSKGRSARYAYYHCNAACGVRYSAPALNEAFICELQKFKSRKATNQTLQRINRQRILRPDKKSTERKKGSSGQNPKAKRSADKSERVTTLLHFGRQ